MEKLKRYYLGEIYVSKKTFWTDFLKLHSSILIQASDYEEASNKMNKYAEEYMSKSGIMKIKHMKYEVFVVEPIE